VVGTLSVLHAANNEPKVKRVVITSSVLAITAGWEDKVEGNTWTEQTWALKESCRPYSKSKLLAEQAAWEFMRSVHPERKLELVTILPSFMIGPLLCTTHAGGSRVLITRFLTNNMPGVPTLHLGFVDVRDVATAHVVAMTSLAAAGNRYICSAGELWFSEVAEILSKEFSPKGYKITKTVIPKALLWLISWWDGEIASILPLVGQAMSFDNGKIQEELGIEFQDLPNSILEMAYSLIKYGFVPRKEK